MKYIAFLLVGAAIAAAQPVSADQSDWRAVKPETGAIADPDGLASLAQSFPDSASVRLRNLQAFFALEDSEAMVREALWLAERGYVFGQGARDAIIERADAEDTDRLRQLFQANSKPVQASEAYLEVPTGALLVESLAMDPQRVRLIASTVISRSLFAQDGSGSWVPLTLPVADSLSGLAFSADGEILWAASGNLGMSGEANTRFAGLFRIQVNAAGGPHKVPAPTGVNPSDLVVSPQGTVYVSDPVGGGIYWARSDSDVLQPLLLPGIFRSPQGLATSEDGRLLYISDYRYGLAVLDLHTMELSRLAAMVPMILDGIDGLWRHGNRLIAIQNGMNPARIVAIGLSEDGRSAISLEILEQAHPDWTEPLGGTIHDNRLYYVGNGQWDRFDERGQPIEDRPLPPTQIRRLPL